MIWCILKPENYGYIEIVKKLENCIRYPKINQSLTRSCEKGYCVNDPTYIQTHTLCWQWNYCFDFTILWHGEDPNSSNA